MPDSSDIEAALMAKLGADAALLALMPNGIYYAEADAGMTKFVIVSLVDEVDVGQFGGRAYEDALYLVKSVEKKPDSGTGNSKAAAARIDVLLEGQVLTVAGYTHMVMHRESRERFIEVDAVDSSIRWQHRGGNYRVQMSVT